MKAACRSTPTAFTRGLLRVGIGLMASVGLALGGLSCMAADSERPSLVLITIDRLAADRLGCFGGPADAGASLCALSRHGFLYGWATTPSLGEASAAASALTGLRPEMHGVDDVGLRFLAEQQETIAESLSRAGYATAAFVSSPRLNRSRRLDQGFALYEDRPPERSFEGGRASIARADAIQDWIENAASPYFLWIHARSEPGLMELDRLIDRLAGDFDRDENAPGILLASLAGEEPERPEAGVAVGADGDRITVRSHRIPLIWRPPGRSRASEPTPGVRFRLVSLLDVAPTLRAAADLPAPARRSVFWGRDLAPATPSLSSSVAESASAASPDSAERFLLLRSPTRSGQADEIGLASHDHLYVRRESPRDGSGRPVPAAELAHFQPRFTPIAPSELTSPDTDGSPRPGRAVLAPAAWRRDVFRTESPVPRLEFHLARRLAGDAPPPPAGSPAR